MDEAYARLSLLAGLFASAADQHLGSDRFISRIRAEAWSLTPEKLAAWRQEALELGVPAERLQPPTEALLARLTANGRKLQQYYDLVTGNAPSGRYH